MEDDGGGGLDDHERQLQAGEQYCVSTGETLDENDRICLRTCHLIDGKVQPQFFQWEK